MWFALSILGACYLLTGIMTAGKKSGRSARRERRDHVRLIAVFAAQRAEDVLELDRRRSAVSYLYVAREDLREEVALLRRIIDKVRTEHRSLQSFLAVHCTSLCTILFCNNNKTQHRKETESHCTVWFLPPPIPRHYLTPLGISRAQPLRKLLRFPSVIYR